MIYGLMAVTVQGVRRWRVFATFAAILLLTAQVGLAIHGASHLHRASETGDCNLCVLNSQFVAESPAVLDLEPVRLVGFLSHKDAETPGETTPQIPTARGPPIAYV